jgi:hypothetical protein
MAIRAVAPAQLFGIVDDAIGEGPLLLSGLRRPEENRAALSWRRVVTDFEDIRRKEEKRNSSFFLLL